MTLKSGTRVKHSTRTDWGLGEVLFDEEDNHVEILFEDVGEIKRFKLDIAKFTIVDGDEACSDYLSALVRSFHAQSKDPKTQIKKTVLTSSFPKAAQKFLSYFPAGFNDPKYLVGQTGEREYKLAAIQLMANLLNQQVFGELIEAQNFDEICTRAKSVINKTNLIHTYEKIWLTNALSSLENREAFSRSLFNLLYGTDSLQSRFEKFSSVLYQINAAKWPIATYFLFIGAPDTQIFVKPQVTQNAADILNISINYRPDLNWLTYSQVLTLAESIKDKLKKTNNPDLLPRDMIDVQSFIWVIAPGYFY